MTRLTACLILLFLGCADTSEAPDCASNDECPAGYMCSLEGPYAGDCIQIVYVIPCGANVCEHPYQACVDGRCVEASEVPEAGLPDAGDDDAGVGGVGGGAGGAGGFGGVGGDGGAGGGVGGEGGGEPAPEPRVVIASPFDGSVFTDDVPPLVGQIFQLVDGADVELMIDDDARPLAVDDDGNFTEELVGLGQGEHRVAVVVSQGEHRVEEGITITLNQRIVARRGQLEQGGRPFRFVGVHFPDLLSMAFEDDGRARVLTQLEAAKAAGATVVRTRTADDRPAARTAIQTAPGQYSEAGWVALDRVIAAAGDAQVKLLLTLIDDAPTYGGVTQYLKWNGYPAPIRTDLRLFFEAGAVREQFKAHVRTLLGRTNSITNVRYSEDPTIMGWVIVDGLDATGIFGDATGNTVNDFYSDLATTVKSVALNQLVTTGDVGFDTAPGPYGQHGDALAQAGVQGLFDGSRGTAWLRNMRIPNVDFATIHLGPRTLGLPADGNAWANLGAAWIRGHAAIVSLESKALVIDTARLPADLDLVQRRAALRAWMDEVLSLELAGITLGNLYPVGLRSGDPAGYHIDPSVAAGEAGNPYTDLLNQTAAELE